MRRLLVVSTILLASVLLCKTPALAQIRQRADIDAKYTWKLEDLYPSIEAWTKARDELAGKFDKVLTFKGKLSSSPDKLLACLKFETKMDRELSMLFSYAFMKSDEDTRVSKYQGMKQTLRQLATDYAAKASFIAPEIAAMDRKTVDDFIRREPGLEIYSMYLEDILRTKAHRLPPEEEKILAEAGLIASAPSSIYGIFSNAEFP